MLLAEKLTHCLRLIHGQLNIPCESILEEVREALAYCENDRERYMELYDPSLPRHCHLPGEGGVFGKSIPVALRTVVSDIRRNGKRLISTKTSILELLVVGDSVLLVEADASVEVTPKRHLMRSAVYTIRREITPQEISPEYQLKPPTQIRPVATEIERKAQKMLLDVFSGFGPYAAPGVIPRKAELALESAQYLRPRTVTIDGSKVTGKLLEVARMAGMHSNFLPDRTRNYTSTLFLLITENELRLVLETTCIDQYFRRVPLSSDFPEEYICETAEEKREKIYRYTQIQDIVYDDFVPCYY